MFHICSTAAVRIEVAWDVEGGALDAQMQLFLLFFLGWSLEIGVDG